MSLRTKRIGLALASCAYLLCYLPAFAMTYHSDDLWELSLWKDHGLGLMVYQWYTWTGKFGQPLLTGLFKTVPIWLPTVLMLSLWWIVVAAIVYHFVQDRTIAVAGSAFLLACMVVITPGSADPLWDGTPMTARDQAFYWQASLSGHTASLIFFCVYLAFLLQRRLPPRLSLALCWFAAFWFASCSEVSIAFLPVMLMVGQPRRRLVGLLGAGMSWGLILLAPGNAVRSAANYGVGAVSPGVVGGLLKTLIAVPGYFKAYLPAWPVLALMVAALVLVSMSTNTRKKHLSQQDKVLVIKAFIVAIASVILAFLPSYIAFGSPIPERAYIIVQFVVVAGIVAAAWGKFTPSA